MDYDLNNACGGSFLIRDCPPLFISVEGTNSANEQLSNRCTDNECRFPDSLRFSINADNLGCFSGVGRLVGGLVLIIVSMILVGSF